MKNMVIAQVVQHLQPGGLEMLALELAKQLSSQRPMIIISLEGEKEAALKRWPQLIPFARQLYFMNKQPGIKINLVHKLKKLFVVRKVDVVHTHHIGPLLYAGIASRLAGITTLVHTEHDAWHLRNFKRRCIQNAALRLVRPVVVADSGYVKEALCSYYPFVKPQVILNGIDTKIFVQGNQKLARKRLGLPYDKRIIGCSARLETVKNHCVLIHALHRLPENVCVALAGTGTLEGVLRAQTKKLGLDNRVIFMGHVQDMRSFYQALDIFCLPSQKEGFPLSLLEAQSCNIPVVATDVGGCAQAVAPSAGELVPPGNIGALVHALERQLTRRKHIINTHAYIDVHFSAEGMAQRYNALFEKCCVSMHQNNHRFTYARPDQQV